MTPEPLWTQAPSFAARAHQGHTRKDGKTPYFAHPARVAMRVVTQFGCVDETAIAAAFLHDTIEDTATDYDDINKRFGREVAQIVAALTKNMLMPEPDREADYDRRLAEADWRARLVKLADVLDNLTDRGGDPSKAASRVQRALKLAEPDRAAHPETDRACRVLGETLAEVHA